MTLQRVQHPLHVLSLFQSRASFQSSYSPLPPLLLHRTAHHAAQGRAKQASKGPGKRLGAKKTGTQLVVPGNIIFRQRGTHWFPGENCGMGRDHTIFAREKGYVTYYKDGENGKKRIGVVFERGMTLPRPFGSARRRRLGLESREMTTMATVGQEGDAKQATGWENGRRTLSQATKRNHQYRETNYEIGRAAEKAKVPVPIFKPGDRFKAWRLRNARKARSKARGSLKENRKGRSR